MNAVWSKVWLDLNTGWCVNAQCIYEGQAWLRHKAKRTSIPVEIIVEMDDSDASINAVFPEGLKGTGLELAEELASRCLEEGFHRDAPAWANCNIDSAQLLEDAREKLFGD